MSNDLTTVDKKANTIRKWLFDERFKKQVAAAIPQHLTVDKLLRISLTCFRTNPKLLDCSQESLMSCVMGAAQLGLSFEPELGQAYPVPYWSSKLKKYEAKLIPGYRGYITLARNSGKVQAIQSLPVYAKDEFDIEYGKNQRLRHIPYEPSKEMVDDVVKTCDGDFTQLDTLKGDLRGAYVHVTYTDGTDSMEFMPYVDIMRSMLRSKTKDNGPWQTDLGKMARKTVIRSHFKLVPLSVEMDKAIAMEEAAIIGDSQTGFVFQDMVDTPVDITDTSEFDRLAHERIGDDPEKQDMFDRFIDTTAQKYDMTIDAARAEAMKDFDRVYASFEQWVKKQTASTGSGDNGSNNTQIRRATKNATLNGEDVKTAGVTSETLQTVHDVMMSRGDAGERLVKAYLEDHLKLNQPTIHYLREEEGQELITRLKSLLPDEPSTSEPAKTEEPDQDTKTVAKFLARCLKEGIQSSRLDQIFEAREAENDEQKAICIREMFSMDGKWSEEAFSAWVEAMKRNTNEQE